MDNLYNSVSPFAFDAEDFGAPHGILSAWKDDHDIHDFLQEITDSSAAHGAFSLVELSIVLVILGLLVGGVLSGQSLIHASELRTIVRDEQKYVTATQSFRDKYFALPGDMPNATSFWNAAAACPGIVSTASGGTCNGDGDGHITSTSTASSNPGNENFRYWQHLAYAGIIEGSYSGTTNAAVATTYTPAIANSPVSKANNTMWAMLWMGSVPISSLAYYDGSYGNALMLGKWFNEPNGVGTPSLTGCSYKPEDAWNVDSKIDDGKPSTGNVVTPEYDAPGTTLCGGTCQDSGSSNSVSLPNAQYSLSSSTPSCELVFKTGI